MQDVIIVGSGFGGAVSAYVLSKAGLNVLLLERGDWPHRDADDWNSEKILIRSRYASETPLHIQQYGAASPKEVSNNEVVGGMSLFYGGASLRMREKDLSTWPVKYSEMEPYYLKAEKLMGIHGKANEDPYEPARSGEYPFPPIPLNEPAERIYKAAKSLGLNPFHLPMSLNHYGKEWPKCIQCHTCDGYPCKISAKGEATRFLKLADPNRLKVLTNVLVSHFKENSGRIESVNFVDKKTGERQELKAKLFILSGGSIGSPAVLLRSQLSLDRFPHHRLTGRRLMRHCNGIMSLVFPFKTNPNQVFHKQLAITDFYENLRDELGTSVGTIQDIYTPERKVVSHFAPQGLKTVAGWFSEHIQSLLCVAEDDPQESNRVELSKTRDRFGIEETTIFHEYTESDYRRRDLLLDRAKKILRRAGGLIPRVMRIDSFSHAVGTLKFGDSDKDSVLDRDCRFFGMKNLFVLDGSFMPTSAGVNPSLTIIANSLRVAEKIPSMTEWKESA